MLGTLKLKLRNGYHFTVTGGPYHDKPQNYVGVKMAQEINLPCAINIPTVDFSEPNVELAMEGLNAAVARILRGERLYIGCMGGKGRTGLFLALLAKAFGEQDPVRYVRSYYYGHAVETAKQKKYVETFVIPRSVLRQIKWAKVKSFFRRPGNLTTS